MATPIKLTKNSWARLNPAVQRRLRGEMAGKSHRRQRGALRSRAEGDKLQAAVRAAAALLTSAAWLQELPATGGVFVGPGKIRAEKMPCDFIGCVVAWPGQSGRGLFFDAKHVGEVKASLALGDEKIVKQHQADYLWRMDSGGAIAGLLVACERCKDYRWWRGMDMPRRNRPRIAWDDPRWIVLGPLDRPLVFDALIEAYAV